MENKILRSLPPYRYWLLFLLFQPWVLNVSAQSLEADFTLSKSNICVGESVTITDNSSGTNRYTRYFWDFGKNAVPKTASGEGPHVVTYTKDGSSEIKLTITILFFDSDEAKKKLKVVKYPSEPEAKITPSACDRPTGILEITKPDGKDIEYSLNSSTWQSSNLFENLSPNENYMISVRNIKENPECVASASFNLPPDTPKPPKIKEVTQPTCPIPFGSIKIEDLPSEGEWTLIRYPGEVNVRGTGKDILISDLPPGEYTFRVMNESGCLSPMSDAVTINEQPATPEPPQQTVFCSSNSEPGMVRIDSPTGEGYEYSLDNGPFRESTVFDNVPDGIHTITVRNSDGCSSTGKDFEVRCSCPNPPSIVLKEKEGKTCSSSSIQIENTTFGGGAEMVIITENGSGRVNLDTAFASPFNVTYTPAKEDEGKTVIITFTTNNPAGLPCEPAKAEFRLRVDPVPSAPTQTGIIHPDCQATTGAITLSSLPSPGQWTLLREPGSVSTEGSGSETTIWETDPGTYTFTVTNTYGCVSESSSAITVNNPPPTPDAPEPLSIEQPDCENATGNITFSNLPEDNWSLSLSSGGIISEGSGTTTTITGLESGSYNFILTNSYGCSSGASGEISIEPPPSIPTAPVIAEVIQPDCADPSGSVSVEGLPEEESWMLTYYPGASSVSGKGGDTLLTGFESGIYTFTVSGSNGCESERSEEAQIIENPLTPDLVINDPDPVCDFETVDLTKPEITENSDPGLQFSYWLDNMAEVPFERPSAAGEGNYYIKAENEDGCFDIKPVHISTMDMPDAQAGPDQQLMNEFETTLEANDPSADESALWTVISGNASFTDPSDPRALVSNLSPGENILLWTITNQVCPPARDSVIIIVGGFEAPTLITPNEDGINDYLKFPGLPSDGKTRLIIFNRLGMEVYTNEDYKNNWNGIDSHGNPLPADTYFYILVSQDGKVNKSFVVLRR